MLNQKGFAGVYLIVGLVFFVASIVLTPRPYYQTRDALCEPCSPAAEKCPPCPKKGWYLGTSLWHDLQFRFQASQQAVRVDSPTGISTVKEDETANWRTYKSSSLGIEFKYPPEYTIQENFWGKNSVSVVIPYRPKGQIMDKKMTFSKETIVPMGDVRKCDNNDNFIESGCYRSTEIGGVVGIEYKSSMGVGDWFKIINIVEPKLQIMIDGDVIFRPNNGDVDKILSTFKFTQ